MIIKQNSRTVAANKAGARPPSMAGGGGGGGGVRYSFAESLALSSGYIHAHINLTLLIRGFAQKLKIN
jgi:hypothetical protein